MSFKPGKILSVPSFTTQPAPFPRDPDPVDKPLTTKPTRVKQISSPPLFDPTAPILGWVDADWDEAWAAAEVLAEMLGVSVEDLELYSSRRPTQFFPGEFPGKSEFLALAAELTPIGTKLLELDREHAAEAGVIEEETAPPEWNPPSRDELLARLVKCSPTSEGVDLFSVSPFGTSEVASGLCSAYRRERASKRILAMGR